MRNRRVVTVLRTLPTSLLIAALASGNALAQQTETQAGEPAAGPVRATARGALEEIVVTATRREESLSKVPISVTALTQESMDQKGIKDFQDIVRYTPGVSIDSSATNAISIRGISSSGGAGTTGIYIDDTPIQMRNVGFNPDDTLPKTFDLERVEVLRGPQGTLFGSGSEGGTVRYILTQPKVNGSSTYMRSELSYTDYAGQPNWELGVAHGGTIIDNVLGFRVSAWYRSDAGWIDRVDPTTRETTEKDINHSGTVVARAAVAWQPVESLLVTPSILYQNSKRHDQSTYWPDYSNPGDGQFNTATIEHMPIPDEYYLFALRLDWSLGKSQIFSNSAYYHRRQQDAYQGTVYDLMYFGSLGWPNNPVTGGYGLNLNCGPASKSPTPPCSWYPLLDGTGQHLPAPFSQYNTPNIIHNNQDSYVQEIRWQSSDDTSPWRWTVGAFWQLAKEESVEELIDRQNNSFFNYLYGQTYESIVSFGNGYPSPFYSCPGQTPGYVYAAIPQCDIYYNRNTTYDRQIAGFGEVSYAFTQQWKLTAGIRVSKQTFSLDHYSDGLENYGPTPKSASQSETPNTPKVSVSYQLNNDNLFYATYAKGFRAGGGNAPLPSYCQTDLGLAGYPNGAPLTYRSDSTQNYEVGSKNVFGNTLKLASSVYYIKWNDIQQSVYVAGGCGLQFTDNLGTAVSKGFDLQAEVAMGPVHVDAAVGYTNARYTKDSAHAGLAHTGDAISGEAAIEYSPGLTPPWTAALGVEYDFRLKNYDSFVRVDWAYQSKNNWPSTLQDPNSSQYNPNTYALPSNTFMQARAGMSFGDWTAALFVDNLLNSHTLINYQMGQYDSYPGSPHANPPYVITAANPAGYCLTNACSVQQNQYTYRPRTIGVNLSYHTH
jgi:iron complex outermembrane recepter protein